MYNTSQLEQASVIICYITTAQMGLACGEGEREREKWSVACKKGKIHRE